MIAAASSIYAVRFAVTAEDVAAAQRLRFEVFNLELNEGLVSSHFTGRDEDRFDTVCDHLLVERADTGEAVGTYRMQTGTTAAANLGYYSETEFDFAPFEPIRAEMVELGRACVHRDHRHANVLTLLWKGIAGYATAHNTRYLIGCSSLTSQDCAVGAATYEFFRTHRCLAERRFLTRPKQGFTCAMDQCASDCPPPPKLLRAYLALGAKICGFPAIDREFGTLDFLTLLDIRTLSRASMIRFGL
jgi:putative hemolysin